jgi:A/G-specific adenine glycosylase
VIKRYFAIRGSKEDEKNLWYISESLLPNKNNNIYTQSIMDLGSLVCLKNAPACNICPIKKNCMSYKLNLTSVIPAKKIKIAKKKNLKLYLILIQNFKNKNLVLMKKNNNNGIWANLWNLPSFEKKIEYEKFIKNNNLDSKIIKYDNIKHNLTHLSLDIDILKIELCKIRDFDNYCWKNIYDNIGVSKPVVMIINKLRKEINK